MTSQREAEVQKATTVNVIVKETYKMNPVALLTPTYGRDLELCTLLCESVDRHVTSFSKHYLLVPDCDLPLFAPLRERAPRSFIPASTFLPDWLRPLPRFIQRKRRQFWWSLRAKPVSGWHVQQFLKIAATISLPHQRYCILDSDIVFFRDFDLSRFEYPNRNSAADHARRGDRRLSRAIRAGSRPAIGCLGCRRRRFRHPISSATSSSGTSRRRARWCRGSRPSPVSTGSRRCAGPANSPNTCCTAISCRTTPAFAASHTLTSRTPCVSYWDSPKLDKGELNQLLRGADKDDVAFSVASFSGTPVQTIRAAIGEASEPCARSPPASEPAGLAALC